MLDALFAPDVSLFFVLYYYIVLLSNYIYIFLFFVNGSGSALARPWPDPTGPGSS